MDTVRIANCSGFYGDRLSALAEVAAEDVDVITGDYLAEVTMYVLALNRQRKPDTGYAATFPRQLEPALGDIAERGIKVATNAGGLNPHGLADVVRSLIADAGVDLTVAVVDGDDVLDSIDSLAADGHPLEHLHTGEPLSSWKHEPLTANAYLGGWGIRTALDAGADIVITGRTTDASSIVGAAAWWHGWDRTDYDRLAGAVTAGHIIECGAQATGGNYSGFTALDPPYRPAFPIAHVHADGSTTITKAAGEGAVTVGTVTAQLLYEIDAPAYLNPDVVSHFDTIRLQQEGDNRVLVSGVRGSAPPATTKVSITALGGYRNSFSLVLTGLDLDAKERWMRTMIERAIDGQAIDEITFERFGSVDASPRNQGEASTLLEVTVSGDERAVGRPFGSAIVELGLASIPGFYGLNLPGAGKAFGTYWPGLVDQAAVPHRVTRPDGTTIDIDPPGVQPGARLRVAPPEDGRPFDGPTKPGPIGAVVDARSGDKGGDANVGLWVRNPDHWPWLRDRLDVDTFRTLSSDFDGLTIDRYELANLGAVNFVVRGLLGDGATANTRLDAQAKALGEFVRACITDIPAGGQR